MTIPQYAPGAKPRIAVHKFTSCDGCQLAFLNLGEDLLTLSQLVHIVHFAEAGPVAPEEEVDVAFVEGSVSAPEEIERIAQVRAHSRFLVAIGACATAGGLQSLRNIANAAQWVADVYASPEHIRSLTSSTALSEHVRIDLELWGCPVNGRQVLAAVRALLFGVAPAVSGDSVCMECKRAGNTCVLVAHGTTCMGPITRTGCGAICPRFGRDCYGCYGPAETVNTESLSRRFAGLGLTSAEVANRFRSINGAAPAFARAAARAGQEDAK